MFILKPKLLQKQLKKVMSKSIEKWFEEIGIHEECHIIVHASLRKIRLAFPQTTPEVFIEKLKKTVSANGSIIFPTFTYCFKKQLQLDEFYHSQKSPSKVGALSEIFRKSSGVIRTSSPTHSFAVWGKISSDYNYLQSPESPLGKFSILGWLANSKNSYVLMLGVRFDTLSMGHYIEVKSLVPWKDYFAWEFMGIQPIGVSINGEQTLVEVPGCSKSFISFEEYLKIKSLLPVFNYKELTTYCIPIELLMKEGLIYFSRNAIKLLCQRGTCLACDSRRKAYIDRI